MKTVILKNKTIIEKGGGDKEQKAGSVKSAAGAKAAQLLSQISVSNMSKPTNVEAQRILTIIEALIEKVQIAAYLDGEFMGNYVDSTKSKAAEEFLNLMSDKTRLLLRAQNEFENRLRPTLLGAEPQDKLNDSDKSEHEELTFEEQAKLAKTNFRNLVRSLQDNPQDFALIKSKKRVLWEEYEEYLNCLKSVRLIMLKKLSTSAEEQASHAKQISELKERIKEYTDLKNHKQLELDNLKKERQKYNAEKSEELNKLKAEIQEIKNNKLKKENDLNNTKDKNLEKSKKAFHDEEGKLFEKLKQIKEDLQATKNKNKSEEDALKKKKQQKEAGLKEIIESYDIVMERRTAEKKEVETELENYKEEVRSLKELLSEIEREKRKEKEIEEKIQKKREFLETEEERINQIVLAIQTAWKQLKAKKGAKKKKGGKAKKA